MQKEEVKRYLEYQASLAWETNKAGQKLTEFCQENALVIANTLFHAWRIPWMEEPGRLQSMGSLRVG